MGSIKFNAAEVLQIAEQIERNGAFFYRAAAEAVADPAAAALLKELADWEVGHEKTFARMRARLPEQATQSDTFDPDGDAARYLQAFADGQVFDVNAGDPAEFFRRPRTLSEILREALAREHDAIVLFTAMRDVVPESQGRSEVEAVIREEVQHVFQITRMLCEAETRPGERK
ncbi:MAG TPA: rubrerythrin [Planctomycetota bacterium]|mgnify:CR=1 FL=1|nr:rubrerythrin [Planctomycetota bacterium]OQC20535.1 MAG: Rubrerythrin [Planctomycetes bacterium ADurb.Bin069]NMD35806.1 rubrerythrin [Planctomycetota bacterium]HNR97939.1 rubrerythrin [Planctomycetota bacterium]HNU24535.1 rubrerythrin [Planctomycetota bacterium]